MRTIIQVPVEKSLRDKATAVAEKQGFSSLQEMVRLFLSQLAENKISVAFTEPPVQLSKRNARRYDKIIDDIESGKVKTKSFTSVKALMDDLNS
jgi:antitoxin component of RelBE/YafQ-DinJ toxin-antitoxin module